jgi:hypothetical protein
LKLHCAADPGLNERSKNEIGWRPFELVHVENMLTYSPEKIIYKSYTTANSVKSVASE